MTFWLSGLVAALVGPAAAQKAYAQSGDEAAPVSFSQTAQSDDQLMSDDAELLDLYQATMLGLNQTAQSKDQHIGDDAGPLGSSQTAQSKDQGDGSKHPHDKLANQATNPGAALIQLQLQNQFIPESHKSSGYANNFIVQPVIPISLGDFYFQNLVTRTTISLTTTPDPDGPVNDTTDLSDTTVLGFAVHKEKLSKTSGYEWGPGIAAIIPTATDDRTGTDKWSLGPGALAIASNANVFEQGDSLLYGWYGYNVWSVAGDSDRSNVNKLYTAPVVVYHFAELNDQKGWYTGLGDELWSFDWKAKRNADTASIPIGARLGRVFSVFGQPINMFVQSDYWAADRGTDPKWDIKLNVTLLFPE